MKKMYFMIGLIAVTVVMSGCNKADANKTAENTANISEANIEESNVEITADKGNAAVTGDSATSIGGKVVVTKQIQDSILALAPALYDYKQGEEITNEMKFAFVYYGYASGNLSRYRKKEIDIEGVKNTWAIIPEADVKQRFMNTFGVDMGEYKPLVNEDDPTIYYVDGNYYVCTTNPLMESTYSHIANEDSVVKFKCQYVGETGYVEYKVTLSGANNSNGYVISGVTAVTKQ